MIGSGEAGNAGVVIANAAGLVKSASGTLSAASAARVSLSVSGSNLFATLPPELGSGVSITTVNGGQFEVGSIQGVSLVVQNAPNTLSTSSGSSTVSTVPRLALNLTASTNTTTSSQPFQITTLGAGGSLNSGGQMILAPGSTLSGSGGMILANATVSGSSAALNSGGTAALVTNSNTQGSNNFTLNSGTLVLQDRAAQMFLSGNLTIVGQNGAPLTPTNTGGVLTFQNTIMSSSASGQQGGWVIESFSTQMQPVSIGPPATSGATGDSTATGGMP